MPIVHLEPRDFTREAIKEVALDHINTADPTRRARDEYNIWFTSDEIADHVGDVLAPDTLRHYVGNPFRNKVVRILTQMAEDGLIVKRDDGAIPMHVGYPAKGPRWAPVDKIEEFDAEMNRRRAAREKRDLLFLKLSEAIGAEFDFTPKHDDRGLVTMGVYDLDKLARAAGIVVEV